MNNPTQDHIIQVRFIGFPPLRSEIIFRMKKNAFLSMACRSYKFRTPFSGMVMQESQVLVPAKQSNQLFYGVHKVHGRIFSGIHRSEVFVYKLHKIKPGDTPHSLGMKDNDIVEVHEEKTFNAYTEKFKEKETDLTTNIKNIHFIQIKIEV